MARGCVYKTGYFMHQRDLVDLSLLCPVKSEDLRNQLLDHEHEHTSLRLVVLALCNGFLMLNEAQQANTHTSEHINNAIQWSWRMDGSFH